MRPCRTLIVMSLMFCPILIGLSSASEERSNRSNGCSQSPDRNKLPNDSWPEGTACQVIDDGDPLGTGRSRIALRASFRLASETKKRPVVIRRVD